MVEKATADYLKLVMTRTDETFVADTMCDDWPTFASSAEDVDANFTVVVLDPDAWVGMGQPETITVTVEPAR